ncbi:uncharacterized protein F5Z01DRAFT_739398 [Emericellopsis atlantica]|uniref:Uncharacterized protein n=1 Tax=Emericellopsis atlantica TaxID=2614577 RepID=A0A9P8CLK9_9HYPO|nr:uncharacterized protein F5Z01DRAFT_739398 [Emericellopsis atlantica]KAG9251172.1 hypothetical protein F5Z01DRAFT_739398 [Emericellopsis atlantica]
MPPTPGELEDWWLNQGRLALQELLNCSTLSLTSREVGYAQAVQRRLRAFDGNAVLHDQLRADWEAAHATNEIRHDVNPRKKLRDACHLVFRRTDDGGIDYDCALEGLGWLDKAESHRQRLLASTREAMAIESTVGEIRERIISELQITTSKRYTQFYLGFRASVLMQNLEQSAQGCVDLIKTMALLNSLFPSVTQLEDGVDVAPSPCSAGLCESIRFTIFRYILSPDAFSANKLKDIRIKLVSWCGMPDYEHARQNLVRYVEETKKLEDACFEALDAIEKRTKTLSGSIRTTSDGTSLVSIHCPHDSVDSANQSFMVSPAPPVPNALLLGFSGREFLAAETDPWAFGVGKGKRESCRPLSQCGFDEHPLARELDLTSAEKAALGLLIPRAAPCQNTSPKKTPFLSNNPSAAASIPPIPPIPESFLEQGKVWQRLARRIRSRTDMRSASASAQRQPVLKSQISDPAYISKRRTPSHDSTPSTPTNPSPSYRTSTLSQQSEQRNVRYGLAQPRISPLEYTRMWLLEKVNAANENRPCQLPAPEKVWRWTAGWEKFLVLPVIPSSINRIPSILGPSKRQRSSDPPKDKVPAQLSDPSCPRLSLNLGALTSLFPSTNNLMAVGESRTPATSHSADIPSSSEIDAAPPRTTSSDGFPRNQIRNSAVMASKGHRKSMSTGSILTGSAEETLHLPSILSGAIDPGDASSMYSQDSQETVIPPKDIAYSKSSPEKLEEGTENHTMAYSPGSLQAEDAAMDTPMTGFPLAASRETLTRNVLDGADDFLNPESAHKTQLTAAYSARSMIAELQPAPLRLPSRSDKKPTSRANTPESTTPVLCPSTSSIRSVESTSDTTVESTAANEPSGFTPTKVTERSREPQHSPTIPDYEPRFKICRSTPSEERPATPDSCHAPRNSCDRSSFLLERTKGRDAMTILPRSDAQYFADTRAPSTQHPTPGRPKHVPIMTAYSTLPSNMTTRERLSQAAPHNPPTPPREPRTPSYTFGNLFRRRNRPKTPTTPSTHYKPFEDVPEGGSLRRRNCTFSQSSVHPGHRESLYDVRRALDENPVPPLPPTSTYKGKKPEGLKLDTGRKRLRKPQSMELLNKMSNGGLRVAFRRG